MTELECMTDYSLVPYDSVCSWGVDTGDVSWSALYIDEIQHVSAPVINISIPEEISWDYTWNDEEFNIVVNGYNVSGGYIQSIIDIQNATPNEEDFNNLVSNVLPLFVPWLFVVLFIYFVFRFVKKVF